MVRKLVYIFSIPLLALTGCSNGNSDKSDKPTPDSQDATGTKTGGQSPTSAQSRNELADNTKIYLMTEATNAPALTLILNRDIEQESSVEFQNGRWAQSTDFNKDSCRLGGAGSSISEKTGAEDSVVFIKSVPEEASSVRIGLPGFKIRSFVLVECDLKSTSKQNLTYGQMKTLTGNLFKLVYK